MSTAEYLGPDFELIQIIDKAYNGLAVGALPEAEQDALRERLIRCSTWADVDPADQALLVQACREVEAGRSPTLQDPASWSADWSAEDAELDAGDDTPAEAKALPVDDDGWVGV